MVWPTGQLAVPELWAPAVRARQQVVPTTPGAVLPPPLLLSGQVDVSEGYEANPTLTSPAGKGDAFTRSQVNGGLHYDLLRLKVDARGSFTDTYFYNVHEANQLTSNVNFVAKSELIPNHLFFNLNTFATPVQLTRVGQIASTSGVVPNASSQQSYGYFANPVYVMKLGDYAKSETSVSESQLFFKQPSGGSTVSTVPVTPLQDATSTTFLQRFSAGPYFGRFNWDLNAAYSDMEQTSQSQQRTITSFSAAYAINTAFAVLGSVAYDQIRTSVPLVRDLPPEIALAGGRVDLGGKFMLSAAAGVAHNFPTYIGSLNWVVTPRFKITGSLTDTISNSQGDILNNLSSLAATSQGIFSDAQSYFWQTQQQALNPQFATISPVPITGLTPTNSLNRDRRPNLAFIHTDERNQYQLTLFGDKRDQLTVNPSGLPLNSLAYGATLSASRKLTRNLTGSSGVTYSHFSEAGSNGHVFTTYTGLSYSLSPKSDWYITGRYLRSETTGQISSSNIWDATVLTGIRHRL